MKCQRLIEWIGQHQSNRLHQKLVHQPGSLLHVAATLPQVQLAAEIFVYAASLVCEPDRTGASGASFDASSESTCYECQRLIEWIGQRQSNRLHQKLVHQPGSLLHVAATLPQVQLAAEIFVYAASLVCEPDRMGTSGASFDASSESTCYECQRLIEWIGQRQSNRLHQKLVHAPGSLLDVAATLPQVQLAAEIFVYAASLVCESDRMGTSGASFDASSKSTCYECQRLIEWIGQHQSNRLHQKLSGRPQHQSYSKAKAPYPGVVLSTPLCHRIGRSNLFRSSRMKPVSSRPTRSDALLPDANGFIFTIGSNPWLQDSARM